MKPEDSASSQGKGIPVTQVGAPLHQPPAEASPQTAPVAVATPPAVSEPLVQPTAGEPDSPPVTGATFADVTAPAESLEGDSLEAPDATDDSDGATPGSLASRLGGSVGTQATTLSAVGESSELELESEPPVMANDQLADSSPRRGSFSTFRYNRLAFMVTGAALLIILLIGAGSVFLAAKQNNKNQADARQATNYSVGNIPLSSVKDSDQLQVGDISQLAVNGQLKVNDTLVIAPSAAPASPSVGQIYYDRASNQPYYYNGTQFVSLAPQHVTSLGGTGGVIGVGQGLSIAGGQLSVSANLLQQIASAGAANGPKVTSLQGQTGDVTLSAGPGIGINGTVLSNSGVVSLAAGSSNLTVTSDGQGNYTVSESSSGGSVTSITGTANQVNVSSSTGNVVLSLPQDIATTSSPTFGGLTLTTPLAVASGGTGANSLAQNGILFGNGTGAVGNTGSANNSVLVTDGTGNPQLSQTLPIAVQANITQTGTLTSGAITSGFGTISTVNNITTTALIQGGSLEITGGNFTVDADGNVATTGVGAIQGAGGLTLGVGGTTTGSLVFANGANSHFTTLQGLAPTGQNQTIVIPASSVATDEVCLLHLSNCVGAGGSVTSVGSQGYIPKFDNAAANQIGDSLLYDNGVAIGLGTVSPTAGYILDVNGNINVSGTAQLGTGLTITSGGASVTGNITQVGVGTFSTGTGAVSLNGNTTVTGSNTFTVGTGTSSLGGALQVTGLATLNGGATILSPATITGTTNINTTGTASTFIGNATGTFGLTSSGLNVSTGGALSGITGYSQASGNFSQSGSGAFSTGTGAVSLNGNVVAAGTLAVQGSGGLTLGVPSSVAGNLSFANSTNSNLSSIQAAAPTGSGNASYTLPSIAGGSTDTLCLETLGNCSGASGAAGGDLTGTYPNPTIAKLQGTTLTISTVASGQVLQYNGSAFVNSLITNSNLQAGAFANITGVGALTSGSIASGFGNINIGSNTFTGNGSGLTSLNGSNISSGTVADARLSTNVTLQGNTFNGAGQLVQLNGSSQLPAVSGALVTNLNGSAIASGTVADARLSTNVTLQGNTFNGPSQLVQLTAGGILPAIDGSLLTNLNGSAISSGTVANSFLVNSGALTVTAGTGLNGGGSVALGGSTTLNVVYGSSANQSAQGNTALSFTGAGNLTGTVSGTAGGGITSNTLAIVSSPTFSGNLAVEGSGGVTIGSVGTTDGVLNLISGSNTVSISSATQANDLALSIPADVNSTDTLCLETLGNCSGASGAAGGDLTGTYPDPTIAKLQGTTLTISTVASGQVLQYNGSAFVNSLITNSNLQAGAFANITGVGALTSGSIASGFGNINIGSNTFTGNGSGLTSLNGSNISSGTVADARLSTNVTLQGNTFNGAGQLVQLTAGGILPSLDGSQLTNLNGSAIASGTVANTYLTNGGALTVTAGTGLNGGGGVALGGTTTLNVSYGATAGTAAQGNTSLSFTGSGNLTGTVSGTAGGGITTNTLAIVSSPTFSGNLAVQGAAGVTIGAVGTTDGIVSLVSGSHTVSVSSATQANNLALSIPADTNTTDTLCLQALANCAGAAGAAGGDLTGTYPNPTIAKLQGTTLTLSSLSSGDVLQYNGSAIVNGHITNSNLTAGTFSAITGTGALAAGSIASGFGTISTANNITTTATIQGNVLNATGAGAAIQLNGTDINTAGTLTNVAYLNQANTFTAAQTVNTTGFNAALTGDSLTFDRAGQTYINASNAAGSLLLGAAGTNGVLQITGNQALIQPGTNTASAFKVVNHAGTTTALDVDTSNTRVGIGTATPGSTLDVNGNTNITGTLTASSTITFSGLSTAGVVHNSAAGVLSTGLVVLGTDTSGNYVANLGTGTGVTIGSNTGAGSAPTIAVNYGALANTAVQGNTTLTCASGTGNLSGGGNSITLGSGGSCNNISITNSPTFTGTLAVQGAGGVTVGVAGTTAGVINLANGTNTNLSILQSAAPSGTGNATYNLPSIAGGSSDTVCLVSLGNCAGSGGGVTGSGTANTIAMFTSTGSVIGNSTLSQSGSTITASGNLAIQGANSLSLGTASSHTGAIAFNNATNANTFTLQAGATASNLTFTLPTADGSNGYCLETNGLGSLSFQSCTGGAGGGVTSLNGLTGVLTLDNATGSGSHVTINDAAADGTTKGIATFNSTNFSASGGVVNTIQGIATTSSPVFVSPNATTGVNTGSGAGTQRIDASGNLVNIGTIASGLINGQTINSTANFTGTLAVATSVTTPSVTSTGALSVVAGGTNQNLSLNASGSGTIGIGGASTGDILIGGGVSSTGCTVTNASGNFGCAGIITSTSGHITSGVAGTTAGQLVLATTGSSVTLSSATQANAVALSIPADVNTTDTLCLQTLGNCSFGGSTAGGDLTGTYPNPTIAKLQGKTLTISATPSTGAVLQYNGSAFVDGLITNSNLTSSTGYTNINGVGALTAGSIASGFGTISTANTITTTSTIQGNVLNATGAGAAIQLNGTDINTSGTLSDVAYLDRAQTFTGVNTFSRNGTGTGDYSLGITGAPVADATSSLIRIGSAIASGNNTAGTGGTYLGLNEPNTGAGSTADFLNFQVNGVSKLKVTNSGAIVAAGRLSVTSNGGINASGTITLSSIGGTGIVHSDSSGNLSSSAVLLGTETSGSYVANLGSLTGLTTTGNSGAGSTPTLSVTYGSSANQSAQGNTALSFTGAGNLTGTVSGTAGGGITSNTLALVNSPTFSGTLSVQGAGGITAGVAGTTAGQLVLATTGSSVTLSSATQANAVALSIPADVNTTDTLCLQTLGNCSFGGSTAGGDLTGTYPNPTIAKLQGKTLTISATPSTGAVLQYNGSAFVDGLITNSNLTSSTGYTNINGVGALTAGSIASGFGTISTANTITTTSTIQGNVLNATGAGAAIQLNGTDINTSGTLSDVAYLDRAQTFTANNTFNNNLTLASSTTGLSLTGAPANNGTSSLIKLGNAISGGNTTTNGGTYLGINEPSTGAGSAADFLNFQVNNVSKLKVDNTGAITAGTFNSATISSTAVNGLTFSGTAITGSGALSVTAGGSNQALTLNGSGSGAINIGGTSTGDILLGGGSASTGCTVTNSNGNFACAGTINGATISGGTLSGGNVSGGTLTASTVNSLNVSGTAISGTGTLTVDANGSNTVSIGGISTGDVLLAGGSSSTGCTVTNATGALTCASTLTVGANTSLSASTLTIGGVAVCTASGCSSSSSGLAKNAVDTSTAAVTAIQGNLYTFTNSSSAIASGVLKLDNGTNTNSAFTVTASGNPTSGQALIFASNTNASPTGNLIDLQSGSSPTSKFSVSAAGVVTAASTINGATISGGTLSGGNVSGGTLTGTAVNSLNVSGTAISGSGSGLAVSAGGTAQNLTLDGATSGQVQIGGTSTGDILLGGGSASTGCTVTNSNGNFACAGTINGATISGGTLSGGNVSGGTLTGTAVNSLNVSGTAISGSGSGLAVSAGGTAQNLTLDGATSGQVQIGGTSTGDILLGGGSASTGCTVTNSNGNFACAGTINGAAITSTTFNTATISGGALSSSAVNGLSVSGGTITNPTIAGTVTGSSSPTITGFGTYNGQTIGTSSTFTGTVAIQGSTALTLGTTSSNTGAIAFLGGGGAGSVTLRGPTTPSGSHTLQIPAITADANICTDNSICAGYAPAAAGGSGYIQKNVNDTSTATYAGTLLALTNNSTSTAGVLSLTNSGTNSAFSILQSGTSEPSAGQALILANNNTTTPTGNLIDLQNKSTSEFNVDINGNSTQLGLAKTVGLNAQGGQIQGVGGASVTGGVSLNVSSNNSTNINTGTSSGAVNIGGSSTGAIAIQSASGITLTAGTASNFTTAAGNLTLQAGSGTVTLGTSTALTASGALAVSAGGTAQTLTLNASTSGQVQIGGTSTGNILLGGGSGSTGCTVTNSTGDYACSGGLIAGSNGTSGTLSLDRGDGTKSFTLSNLNDEIRSYANGGNSFYTWYTTPSSIQLSMELTSAGQLQLPANGSSGGIQLGSDVDLYRSAANVLKTDDTVNSVLGYQFNGTAGVSTTCGSNQYLQAQTVAGGITTGGTCTTISPIGLAKNAVDTSSAAVTALQSNLYTFTNSSSAIASGVLKLDNGTNTNSALTVTASGNPTSGQALIFASNTNASPSGNLLDLQSGSSPTSKFSVSATGLVTGVGGATISGSTINLNASSNNDTNINTGSSTGAVNVGNGSAGAIAIQSASTVGITAGTSLNLTSTGSNAIGINPGGGSNTGVVVKPTTDSTATLQVQKGSNSATVFDVDTTNSRVGVGTSAPGNLLSIGALTTAQSGYQVAVSTGGTTSSGIVVQTVASQSAGYILQAQDSTGATLASIDYQGNLSVKSATINGNLTVTGHIITGGGTPTATKTSNLGTGAGATCTVTGTDTSGVVNMTIGSSPHGGDLCTITFSTAYSVAPHVVVGANNQNAGEADPYSDSTGSPTTSFFIGSPAALSGTTSYTYIVAQ